MKSFALIKSSCVFILRPRMDYFGIPTKLRFENQHTPARTLKGLPAVIPTKLRFENQQKKTHFSKKQKQAMFFSLLRFQHLVDLFVTAEGFKPPTLRAEI